ncbi:MAG TPA: redoxin domain-containing protein [Candidatus Acidoferrum sp.]|nr:redoxin domain-containing protein [Candidatus Acidoferrum sp.]
MFIRAPVIRRTTDMFKLIALALLATTSLQPVYAATDWIGARVHAAELAGKVVILDFFTVDCYNCRNVVPTLRSLYAADRNKGLAIVGIHTPETPPEKERSYVTQSLRQQGIVWPVAVDNAFSLWDMYRVNAWPTQLFFDRHGTLRKVIIGDSQDDAVRAETQALLQER